MLNLADFLVAGFIFLLFVSVYRKKRSAPVRFWVTGWFCVVLHFAALVFRPHSPAEDIAQGVAALCTLVLCGTAFGLSHPKSHAGPRRTAWIAGLLGIPWLMVMILGCLSPRWFLETFVCAALSEVCVLAVALRLFGWRHPRLLATALLVAGCGLWLWEARAFHNVDAVQSAILTLCFGFIAVLLSARTPRLSVASLTTSVGAVSWGGVWAASALLDHYAPALLLSTEIWNLPKYFVAAGMVLGLLDEEIRATERASEQYRLLFAGNPHPMWIYDPETLALLEVNDAAVKQYGFSRQDFLNMNLLDIAHVDHDDDAESIEELRAGEAQTLTGPWLHRRADGSEFQVEIATQPVLRGRQRATVAMMHDVTEPQRLHAQLIRQAHHDVLTDLPNRALFEQKFETELAHAAINGCTVAVFCMDLDRFKQINDTFGHAAGDLCLCEMTRRILGRLQGAGTLARTGGDEFMLVMGGLSDAREAEQFAAQVLADLKATVPIDGGEVELIASIGIALFPHDGTSAAQLWRDADVAMYRAKRAGGSQWVRVSRELSDTASEANEIELSLRRSLRSGEFALSYQPQVTAAGAVHSLEALVRFTDPLLAKAPADRVIAIAEESGLIVPLGEWVLEEVCRQLQEWSAEGLEPVQIALNVSQIQLNRFNFSLQVASALERYGLDPQLLEFEVTESTMMPDKGQGSNQIAILAEMGIRFSVDDFGTGYSSLGRLHQLPVESLKIDCSFTQRIAEKKGTYPTVQAIIALAHTFGMRVVAEGVETEEQLELLRSLGCDRMQGYLFSRPVPAQEARMFLDRSPLSMPEVEVA